MVQWTAETRSRSLEIGSILQIIPSDADGSASIPAVSDQLCINVAGEKFPASIADGSPEYLTISLLKGPMLFAEPVAVGHPAHGERQSLGIPTSLWRVVRVTTNSDGLAKNSQSDDE